MLQQLERIRFGCSCVPCEWAVLVLAYKTQSTEPSKLNLIELLESGYQHVFASVIHTHHVIALLIGMIYVPLEQAFAKQGQLDKAKRDNAKQCIENERVARNWVSQKVHYYMSWRQWEKRTGADKTTFSVNTCIWNTWICQTLTTIPIPPTQPRPRCLIPSVPSTISGHEVSWKH